MEQSKPVSHNSRVKILVVDDHPNTANMLARAISQLGSDLEVLAATSGKEALECVNNGAVDILITDMIMPEMTGLELIEALQKHPAGRPTFSYLITAYNVPGLEVTARRLHVKEVILKPIPPQRICQIVIQALEEIGQSKPAQTQAPSQKPFNILIADDIADNVTLLARYLEAEGYAYLKAENGLETLLQVRKNLPDLVLLDINMPDRNGFDVLREIRADPATQHIPVIILTATRLDATEIQHGLNLGADDYVTKPFDRRELLARIRTKLRVKEAEDHMRRRNQELNLLPEIGKELSARMDIDELSSILLKRTVETLGAFLGYLVIKKNSGFQQKTYQLVHTQSFDELPLPHDLFENVRTLRQGFIIEDIKTDQRWAGMPAEQIQSAVVAPLFGRHELLGLLILAHEQKSYFKIEHLLLLQAICSQAAIAAENANLFTIISYEQKRLAAVLRSTADAILMFDANDSLALINPAGERLFTDFRTRLGMPLARGMGYDALIALLEEAYASGSPQTGEIVWPDKRVFATLITPIEDGGHVVTLHDVTHFKEVERVKNEFIATASHDLKNPIASITGFSHLMTIAGPLNEQQQEFLERIQSAAKTMNELVQNLLQLVQLDLNAGMPVKSDPVNFGELIAQVADEYKLHAEAKHQSMILENSQPDIYVRGDAMQFAQALRNLVGNAIKYTPDGGTITVSLTSEADTAVIEVKDTGLGIPSADLPHIFERFYRVKDSSHAEIEGNGLGLAIVKSVVEKHGGQISVESEVSKSSCFIISLPVISAMSYSNP